MINIARKEECCGCGACFDACGHNAIEWYRDEEGFSYPKVNLDSCINCGLCEKTCPIINSESINSKNKGNKVTTLGCYLKDDEYRLKSTSGGVFWGLAEPFVKARGYVAGAIFDEDFHVVHYVTNDINELEKIRRSKYVQGDCRGLYRKVRTLLMAGEKVMATGLPCQMAALRQFLHRDYDNLLVVDLICHSVTSPLAFEKYKDWLEDKYHSKLVDYHPKNKEFGGWHKFAVKATFENGKIYHMNNMADSFTWIFVGEKNILCRPSCYECRYKEYPKPSDITIGDLWGVETIDPDFDSSKGISKLMINTQKGYDYFYSLRGFITKEYDDQVITFNNYRSTSQIRSVSRPSNDLRHQFLYDLNTLPFDRCMKKYMPKESNKLIRFAKRIIKIILKW